MKEQKKEESVIKDNDKYKVEKTMSPERKHKILIISLISVVAVLTLLLGSTGFALANISNTKIMSNVKINNIKVEGLTKEEAKELITKELNKNLEKDIIFKIADFEYPVKLSQIETKYDIEKAVTDAYNVGRSGNVFKNNFAILRTMTASTNITIEATYNEELLNNIVSDMAVKMPNAVEQSSYYIEGETLIVTKGKAGDTIEKEKVKKTIEDRIYNSSDEEVNLDIIHVEPNAIDIEKIYSEVHTEAKDAYYTKDPFQIYPHVNGIDFDLDAAKELLKEDKEEYEIKLTITKPEITTDKIGTEAFPDLLSSFSTKYDASNINRSTNLRLAAEKINGTVLMPGEVFSYNKVVGERTIAKGYREANGFAAGGVVGMVGGGICQIASTLYDAVVYANLEVVDRTNHGYDPGYVVAGKDATVVYGSIDFKFKNTRKNPIMIKSYVGNGIAKMEIFGIKEDVEYEVSIESTILSYIPFGVRYEDDSSLEPGQERVSQKGMQGMKSITYKILKLNGKEISRTVLSTDTYQPMTKVIQRGPEGVSNEVVEEPQNVEPVTTVPVEEPVVTPQEPETTPEQPETQETSGDQGNG